MATTNPNPKNDSAQTLDKRDARALTEKMTTLSKDAPDMFSVTTESGSEYTVDARGGSCTCPDARHRDVQCKHIRRVRFAVGRRTIPDWCDTDAVDPQLGDHVSPAVATDGGTDNDSETCEDCAGLDGMPCFEHFDGGDD